MGGTLEKKPNISESACVFLTTLYNTCRICSVLDQLQLLWGQLNQDLGHFTSFQGTVHPKLSSL